MFPQLNNEIAGKLRYFAILQKQTEVFSKSGQLFRAIESTLCVLVTCNNSFSLKIFARLLRVNIQLLQLNSIEFHSVDRILNFFSRRKKLSVLGNKKVESRI